MTDESRMNWAELLLARRREAGGDETRECNACQQRAETVVAPAGCFLWADHNGAHSWARGWHE